MNRKYEEFIVDIVERENRLHGDKYDISTLSPLVLPPTQERSNDSAMHFQISGVQAKDNAVISVSNPQFPDAVSDAGERGSNIAARVNDRDAKPIVRPVLTGHFGDQSYAFWQEHQPLSKNRFLRKAQLFSINRRILDWLGAVGAGSRRIIESDENLRDRYIAPIEYLINDNDVSGAVKSVAKDALRIVEGGDFGAVSTVQHGDLWYGNVMLAKNWPGKSEDGQGFYVIDWGGSQTHGYPYADLVRYLVSIGASNRLLAQEIEKYGIACGLNNEHVHAYICSSIGHVGLNRNEFATDSYLRLCDAMIAAIPTSAMTVK